MNNDTKDLTLDAKIQKDVQGMVKRGEAIKVVTQKDRDKAYALAGELGGKIDEIEAWFEALRKPAWDSYQAVLAKKKEALAAVTLFLSGLKKQITTFDSEKRRKEQEERAAAIKAAEDKAKAEKEKLEKEAAEKEAGGNALEAFKARDKALRAATDNPAPVQLPPTKKQKGSVCNWDARVTSLNELIKEVYAGKVSMKALTPNMVYLRDKAKKTKGPSNILGVEFYDKGSLRFS